MIRDSRAAWNGVIRFELWNGVRGNSEPKRLRILEAAVLSLQMQEAVWDCACEYAAKARVKGLTVPPTDHAIFACARVHGIELLYGDQHFDELAKLT